MAYRILLSAIFCGLPLIAYSERPQIINADGYVAETHHVTTEDGYILEMHRIPYRRGESESSSRRPVVFLMHGLLSASNSFVLIGPDNSPGYNLADAGFDVWMGNNRGNKPSRYHVTLDPNVNANQFFDYTFEEIGMYDVAAMVDYILDFTGEDQLHYIGHSQGGTVFLVLTSMRPEYNFKFKSVHLLAGVGYQEYFPNEQLAQTALLTDVIYNMAVLFGSIELFPPDAIRTENKGYSTADLCTGNIRQKYLCDIVGIRHILRNDTINEEDDAEDGEGGDEEDDEEGEEEADEEGDEAGGSLKQVAHFGQNIRDKLFRRWGYGTFQNLQVYGTSQPPSYDLSLITANVTMHYTVNDYLLDERDVFAMVNDMPNAIARKVARETFLHEDFVVADDAKELVTDYIIEFISSIEFHDISDGSSEEPVIIFETEGGSAENENNESEMEFENQTTGSATKLTFNFILVVCALFILQNHTI